MSEPAGVVLAREDGLVYVPNAIVVHGLVEAVERLYEALGIPARDDRERQYPDNPDSLPC